MFSNHHGLEAAEDWVYCAAAVAGLKGVYTSHKDEEMQMMKR